MKFFNNNYESYLSQPLTPTSKTAFLASFSDIVSVNFVFPENLQGADEKRQHRSVFSEELLLDCGCQQKNRHLQVVWTDDLLDKQICTKEVLREKNQQRTEAVELGSHDWSFQLGFVWISSGNFGFSDGNCGFICKTEMRETEILDVSLCLSVESSLRFTGL
jgi:hypothetical protein